MSPQFPVPGYNEPLGDWKEEFTKRIESGTVLPIISNTICNDLVFGGHLKLVRQLMDSIAYPLREADDLIRRLQYVSVMARAGGGKKLIQESYLEFLEQWLFESSDKDLLMHLKHEVELHLKSVSEKAERVARPLYDYANPLVQLASFPLPIFLTTSYHSFLETALTRCGKKPRTEVCLWKKSLRKDPRLTMDSSFVPYDKEPLVFHLHGLDKYPESIVLAEDDYFDFVAELMADKDLLPKPVRTALSSWAIMLLGYDLRGWDFKSIFHSIIKPTNDGLRKESIAIQLSPEDKVEKEYLEKYLRLDADFEVYWQPIDVFVQELWQVWASKGRPLILPTDESAGNFS
jgi:hypothetical protein